jgi:hypothetical protein
MASTLPSVSPCCTPCEEPTSVEVPGAAGAAGADGANGADGVSAFSVTTAQFTMPAELANVDDVDVDVSTWMTPNQNVYVQNAGWMEVQTKSDSTHVTLKNLKDTSSGAYLDNVAPGTVVAASNHISPGGLQGQASTIPAGVLLVANDLSDVNDSSTSRINLGVEIGTDVQAFNVLLLAISNLVTSADTMPYFTGLNTVALTDLTSFARTLLDDVDAATFRATLGIPGGIASTAYFEEQQASGVNGGSFTNGAWRTRALNTEVFDPDSIASVAASQITVATTGTYRIRGWAGAYSVEGHQVRLQNITTTTEIAYGSPVYSLGSSNISTVEARVALTAGDVIELQHQCQTTVATVGLGISNSWGGTQVYSGLKIELEA